MGTPFTTDLIMRQSPLNGQPGRRKVALAGFTDRMHRQLPLDDPDWEIWGFNMANRLGFMLDKEGRFRADRWFDLHPLSVQDAQDLAWIACCPVPLYLTEPYPPNPRAQVYPLDRVALWAQSEFGRCLPFASSFAYAVALAVYLGFAEIGLFGCDLDWGRERAVERGNLEAWAALALGAGIEIYVPPGSRFWTHPARYGFDYHEERDAVDERMVRLMFELHHNRRVGSRYSKLMDRYCDGDQEQVCRELWGSNPLVVQPQVEAT